MVTFDVADNQLDQIFISGQLHQERQQAAIAAAGMEAAATIAQQQDAMKAMEAAHQTALDELNFKNAGLLRTNQQQSELLKKAAETDRLYDALRTSIEEHLGIPHNSSIYDAIKAIKDENTALKVRIAELEFAQPPVTPPVVFPSDPVKPPHADPVYPFCGGYLEDPRENDSVDSQAEAEQHFNALRPSMEFAAEHNPSMGDYIVFGNLIDFKHGGTVKEILRLGKRPWLSPVQAYYGKPQFTDHLKAARDAGYYGVFVDDAENCKDFIVPLLDAVNRYMPNAPVICSFGAEFDDSAYPRERYYDMRQWFISAREKESVYFQKWETSQDAALYAADVYRRGNGFQHTPERVRSMFDTAMPFVDGIAWYSLLNQQTHIMNDHKKMKAQNPGALTVWDVIVDCTNDYLKTYAARIVKAQPA